ncbi:hypothetical protein [Ferruginibacter sp.]
MSIQVNMNRAMLYRQRKMNVSVSRQFEELTLSKKKQKSINLFFWGLLLNCLSYLTAITSNPVFSPPVCQGFQAIALAMVISSSIDLMKFKFDDKYLESIFPIFIFYCVGIIFRDPGMDYNTWKRVLFDPGYGMMGYLVPLVILFPRNLYLYKRVFYMLMIFGALFIVYVIAYYDVVHNPSWTDQLALAYTENFFGVLSFPTGFILLTFVYHKKKVNRYILALFIFTLYLLIFRARRGAMLLSLTTLAATGMMYLIYTKQRGLLIALSVFFAMLSTVSVSNIKLPGMFDFLMSRGDEDTRTGMEVYMKADMNTTEWLFGKGINGKYYCPVLIDPMDLSGKRDIIETGYLQMALKGGYIYLGLYLAILIPALYRGFFKSKNMLAKGAAMHILLSLVYIYPTIVEGFGFFYLILWMSAGICYSKKIRNMSDITIKTYLQRLK